MINLLKIELLKLKNSSLLKIGVAVLFISIITAVQFILSVDSEINAEELISLSMNMFGLFYYPIFVTLFVSILIRIENNNNTWKLLLTSGDNKINIYLSKYMFILIIVSIGLLFYTLTVTGISIIKLNTLKVFLIGIKKWIYIALSSLGFISIEFIIALSFKSFFIPIAVGFMGIFVTFITSISGKYIMLNPFGYATNAVLGTVAEKYILLCIIISIFITIISILYIVIFISKKNI
ncbi:ABC transporter permease [Clostridium perfringens]|uniref:ABC transporter permease n=1 Tax=Clostridium perfringens TaxID=1502 RepID=UPI002FCD136F